MGLLRRRRADSTRPIIVAKLEAVIENHRHRDRRPPSKYFHRDRQNDYRAPLATVAGGRCAELFQQCEPVEVDVLAYYLAVPELVLAPPADFEALAAGGNTLERAFLCSRDCPMKGDMIALADTCFELKFEIWKSGAALFPLHVGAMVRGDLPLA